MSRGPGVIERAVEATFAGHPSSTFTVEELAALAYPGVNRVEKKHRVAVIRAADKVGRRMGWIGQRAERPGGTVIYSNLYDVRSYSLGRLRRDFLTNWRGSDYPEKVLDDPTVCPRDYESAQLGGAWWLHVEINKAVRDRRGDDEAEARAVLGNMVNKRLRALGTRL